MTDDEIAQLVAAGDAVSSPEAIASYFNSPAGKQALANQQLGVNKWAGANSTARGGTNTSAFMPGSPEWAAAVAMGGAAAGGALGGGASGAGGLSDVTVPSAGAYLSPVGSGAAGAAVGPPSSLAGSATSMVPPEGASSGGWQQQVKRLFHMGGNSGSQRQPYRYQNPQVADYAQQQQMAEMLADALNKRQPVDPIVRGGPVPIGRY